MNFALFPNLEKENIEKVVKATILFCHKNDITVFLPDLYKDNFNFDEKIIFVSSEEALIKADIAFALGGDGTIIELAKQSLSFDIPVCGINLGELGFLNQIEVSELEKGLEKILHKDYIIENRSILMSYIKDGAEIIDLPLALNDVVVTRKEPGKMARINLFINESYVQEYPSDGIIIATATGSTGYNLSADGPIMYPTNHSIIVTPICPHLLQSNPLVLTEDSEIAIGMPDRQESLYVSIDGVHDLEFFTQQILHIKHYDKYAKFIRFKDKPFFSNVFDKLNGRNY